MDVPGPLLGKGLLWFDSCKQPPPVSDHSVFTFWVVVTGGWTVFLHTYHNFVFICLFWNVRFLLGVNVFSDLLFTVFNKLLLLHFFFLDVLELSMSPEVSSPIPEPTNHELLSFVKQGNFVYFIFLVGLIW